MHGFSGLKPVSNFEAFATGQLTKSIFSSLFAKNTRGPDGTVKGSGVFFLFFYVFF